MWFECTKVWLKQENKKICGSGVLKCGSNKKKEDMWFGCSKMWLKQENRKICGSGVVKCGSNKKIRRYLVRVQQLGREKKKTVVKFIKLKLEI